MATEKIANENGEVKKVVEAEKVIDPVKPYSVKPRAPRETFTPLGDKWKISAKLSVDPVTGEPKAEPGEKIDLDAYIQASKASTDIVSIIAKLKAGDESVINVRQGFYGDATILPKDINDITAIERMNQSARESFDKLPAEVQKAFGNDPQKFFSAVLDGTANSTINAYAEALAKAQEKVSEGQGE